MTGDLVKAMRGCPQPIIAAVDGVCAGAGAIIAMARDLRLGTPTRKTAFLFTRVGLAGCDMGACAILPRIIGQGRAAELLYTGRAMSATEGERWGFFNALHPADELDTQFEFVRGAAARCRSPSARLRALMARPVYSSSAARPGPMMRGSMLQAPMSAPASPTRTNRNATLLRAVPKRISDAIAMIAPAPAQTPSIAATIGCGQPASP